jgi:hypothetical protein
VLQVARAAIVLALSVGYLDYAFQLRQGEWLTSGLSLWLDPYLINGLLEQWHYSVWHLSDPSSPPMFFPATGTLGYSVGLILYAPFYIAARLWLHPFPAYTLTLFLVMLTGTLCLYAVLRRFLQLGFVEAILVTALFCTSGNIINGYTNIWAQVLSVFLIPPILLLGLVSARRRAGPLAWCGACLTGLLAALLFTQDFYTGLLALLLTVMLLIGARLVLHWPTGGGIIRMVEPSSAPVIGPLRRVSSWALLALGVIGVCWAWIDIHGSLFGITFESHHHHWERPAIVALAGFVSFDLLRAGTLTKLRFTRPPFASRVTAFGLGALAGGFVFLWIYLSPFREHFGFSEDHLAQSLIVRDLSSWRHPAELVRSLMWFAHPRSLKLVFIVGLIAWVPWLGVQRRVRMASLWFLLVSVFVVLAGLHLSGFSIWQTFFAFWPGFSAIRDPKRLIFSYELVAALATGLFLAQLPRRSLFRWSISALAAVLLVTEWNGERFTYGRSTAVFDQYVQAPITIDPSCRSFFVRAASAAYEDRSPKNLVLYNIDAMFIATKFGVPTLNGYSAWVPSGWDLINPPHESYPDKVATWISRHQLKDVCALDLEARTMTRYR